MFSPICCIIPIHIPLYEDAILFVIDYVENNAFFLSCAYDSIGRDQLKRFFCQDFFEIIDIVITNIEKETVCTIDEHFRTFISNLYAEGIAGLIINLFQAPDHDFSKKN